LSSKEGRECFKFLHNYIIVTFTLKAFEDKSEAIPSLGSKISFEVVNL
jgi:hypothetical protein